MRAHRAGSYMVFSVDGEQVMATDAGTANLAQRLGDVLGLEPERAAAGLALLTEHVEARLATKADVAAIEEKITSLRDEIGREADGLLGAICREMGTSASVTEKELNPIFRRHANSVSAAVSRHTVAVGLMLAIAVLFIAALVRFS